jgi:hypothetical protein
MTKPKQPTQPCQPSKLNKLLDLLHKGIWPAITIGVAIFVFINNTDKQRQIDRLQSEIQTLQDQQHATTKKQQDQVKQAEEVAQRMRVDICRGSKMFAQPDVRACFALVIAGLKMQDGKYIGEDKATDLWDKAWQQVEKELEAARPADWSKI